MLVLLRMAPVKLLRRQGLRKIVLWLGMLWVRACLFLLIGPAVAEIVALSLPKLFGAKLVTLCVAVVLSYVGNGGGDLLVHHDYKNRLCIKIIKKLHVVASLGEVDKLIWDNNKKQCNVIGR